MSRYLLRRLRAVIIVLFGVTLITFTLMHFTAGSYVPGISGGRNIKPADVERIKANLGLDRPVITQYADWIGVGWLLKSAGVAWVLPGNPVIDTGVLEGNFGRSLIDGAPVLDHVLDRLPNTIELTGTAMLLGLLLSVPLGVFSALHRGSRIDRLLTALSVAGFSVPEFWLGLLLILLFSVSFRAWGLPNLPSTGATSAFAGGDLLDRIEHLAMPASVLAFFYFATWSRFVRSSMIEVLSQDYIRTARSKGMPMARVLYVHALRNGLTSLVTLIGLELPDLLSGSLVIEVVFSWPGIGLLAYQRALGYDYTTVMGITTFVAILVVVGNLLADLSYGILDPRVRYS
ncbi:MAG TPA: ABC transporter permease [Candidatus Dormibacteraeota bacterium]|jgi:peptide/nickel transport system permease protein